MIKFRHVVLFAGLLAAGCANIAPVDTAVMPPGSFTTSDVDSEMLYEASQALGLNATRPPTVQGLARGLAQLDYVAGAFNTHARWIGIDGTAQTGILIARAEMRDAIGIPRSAPSQAVVEALLAVSRAGDAASMRQALTNPVFALGPAETEARLRNLPPLFQTPYAIARLNRAISTPRGSSCNNFYC